MFGCYQSYMYVTFVICIFQRIYPLQFVTFAGIRLFIVFLYYNCNLCGIYSENLSFIPYTFFSFLILSFLFFLILFSFLPLPLPHPFSHNRNFSNLLISQNKYFGFLPYWLLLSLLHSLHLVWVYFVLFLPSSARN